MEVYGTLATLHSCRKSAIIACTLLTDLTPPKLGLTDLHAQTTWHPGAADMTPTCYFSRCAQPWEGQGRAVAYPTHHASI